MQRTTLCREKSHGDPSSESVPLDELPVIELSTRDIRKAYRLASNRNSSYLSIDGGRIYGSQTGRDAHVTGLVGEIAVAQFLGSSLDENVYSGGDDGFDTILNGITIDVKSTKTEALDRPELIVPAHPEPNAHLYFLTHWIADREVRLIGYASLDRVINREPERAPGTTLNYIVPPRELCSPWKTSHAATLADLLFPREELP